MWVLSSFSYRKQEIHLLLSCFLSSLSYRKQRIHLLSTYFLVFFFSSAPRILFCFRSAPWILFCFSSTPWILFCFSSAPQILFFFFIAAFSLQILWGNLDFLWYDSHMFGMYGIEVFDVLLFFCVFPFFFHHGLCWNWHVITLLFSISSFIIFFPMLHCIPILSTSFMFSATWISMVTIFILINLWSLGFSPSGQYQCFIYINLFFSIPADTLSLHFSSSSCSSWHVSFILTSSSFPFQFARYLLYPHFLYLPCSDEPVIFRIFMPRYHVSFIHSVISSLFFMQGLWNNTSVIFLPIFFTSSLSFLRINLDLIFIIFPSFYLSCKTLFLSTKSFMKLQICIYDLSSHLHLYITVLP